jgi:uncharacterized membrane protein YgcG
MKWFTKSAVVAVMVMGGMVGVAAPALAATGPSTVLDGANVLNADDEQIITDEAARDLKDYNITFVVETVRSLDGKNVNAVAESRANALEVGGSANNGVFLLISQGDRQVAIQAGAKVEKTLSSDDLKTIVDDTTIPKLHTGNYLQGIVQTFSAVGDKYTGLDIHKPTQSDSDATDSGSGRSVVGIVFGIIGAVAGTVLLIIAGFAIRKFIDDKRSEERARVARAKRAEEQKLAAEHKAMISSISRAVISDTKIDKEFRKAPGMSARKEMLTQKFPEHDFSPELYDEFWNDYLRRVMMPLLRKNRMDEFPYWMNYNADSDDRNTIEVILVRIDGALAKESKRLAEQAEKDRIRRQKEEAQRLARQRAEAAEKRSKEKAAKEFWKGLTSEQKKKVQRAPSQNAKVGVLSNYNTTDYDSRSLLPVLIALYASEVSTPSTSYGGHSTGSGSSGSDTPSYNPPSYTDTSSFTSFDSGSSASGGF